MKTLKKTICFIQITILLGFVNQYSFSQSVGINTASPDGSAALDVVSTNKGMLVPRLSTIDRMAINSPAKGLLVFDNTVSAFFFFNGTSWTNLSDNLGNHTATQNIKLNGNSLSNDGTAEGISIDNNSKVRIGGGIDYGSQTIMSVAPGIIEFDANGIVGGKFKIDQAGKVGINNNTPNASAQLDIASTTKGMLTPRMTTAQRTAIASPAKGLLVFDISENNFFFFDGTKWLSLANNNTAWGTKGNSDLNENTDFIGSTNGAPLNFRIANAPWGKIAQLNTSIGDGSLSAMLNGTQNVAYGNFSLKDNISGSRNTAIGAKTLLKNLSNNNTAIGYEALSESKGSFNTAVGNGASSSQITGNYNTAIGNNAMKTQINGNYNIAIGNEAAVTDVNGSNQLSIANKLFGLFLDTNNPQFGINTPNPTHLLHLYKNSSTDGTNELMLLENAAIGGIGLQFKNGNSTNNDFQIFMSKDGKLKIGRDLIGDYMTLTPNGNMGIGVSPEVKTDINGGFAIRKTNTYLVTSDNYNIPVGNQSYIMIGSNDPVAEGRTIYLSDGLVIGQMLIIQGSGNKNNFFSLVEGSSNVDLPGDPFEIILGIIQYPFYDMNGSDTLQLIWNGNDWCSISFQNITQ